MKLVDILARELKAWPFGGHFAWQDYDKEVRFSPDSKHDFHMSELAEDNVSPRHGLNPLSGVTRAEWQAAVDALNAPKVVEWAKGSLPPIGSVVEWDGCTFAAEDPQEKDLHVGDQVTIIAHLKDGDFEIAAFTFNPSIHNAARGSVWVNQGARGCFRPVRTAEQVAAEEWDKARTEVLNAMTENGKTASEPEALWKFRLKVVGEMLDMGYRKDPKPCGS